MKQNAQRSQQRKHVGPVYIRLARENTPVITTAGYTI